MAEIDLILVNGHVLTSGQLVDANVLVADGKIAGIVDPSCCPAARQTLDVSGLVVMPGMIDCHMHLGHGTSIAAPQVPGDADSESAAAAAGGITTFIPFILSTHDYTEVFSEIRDIMEAGSRIDFGMHFILANEMHLSRVGHYVRELGIPTIKFFMTGRGAEAQRLGMDNQDDGRLFRLIEELGKAGGMLCPHPENVEIVWTLQERVKVRDPEGRNGLASWNEARPAFVEAEAVNRAVYLARQEGVPVYLVHISSKEALDAALAARRAGDRVFIETCVHYLLFDTDSGFDGLGKVNPPLRTAEDREALWNALRDGHINTVTTDHVHRPKQAKLGGIWTAAPGFPGMETALCSLLEEAQKRSVPVETVSRLVSENPARIMGLPQKGTISIGADADFAIVDMNRPTTVTSADIKTSAGYSLFEGKSIGCSVVHTFVRGQPVLQDGKLVSQAVGTGRFVPRRLTHLHTNSRTGT
ncbi:dihydroorotase [Mesorhizobium sp. Root157]|uniref:dihydroorotase n=1 Tax=Mesorhizobium sp. Root157 TaxID=1736477 RepID=UPI0006F499FB|nr:dihydroorotase family protein [Mesorhizobium sp. Root157]KQZ95828.1 dihydroorotase [Mesorhizobium sp. Root157]